MRLIVNSTLVLLTAWGSFSLIACGNGKQATNPSISSETAASNPADDGHDKFHHGHSEEYAQIIVSGPYHLELIAEPKGNGINFDFHLENEDTHEPIPNANVSAVVKLPNGNEQALSFQYEAEGEHYLAFMDTQINGSYDVTVSTDFNGESLNTQFSFDQ